MYNIAILTVYCLYFLSCHHCRVMGSLLSAHLLITDPEQLFGDLVPEHYDGELLTMAHDLADRLLPAFESSHTGLPLPRVSRGHV